MVKTWSPGMVWEVAKSPVEVWSFPQQQRRLCRHHSTGFNITNFTIQNILIVYKSALRRSGVSWYKTIGQFASCFSTYETSVLKLCANFSCQVYWLSCIAHTIALWRCGDTRKMETIYEKGLTLLGLNPNTGYTGMLQLTATSPTFTRSARRSGTAARKARLPL